MTWLRLDDQFHRHRKVAPLSDAAFRLHVTVMLECANQLTDGRIDCALVPTLPRAPSSKAGLKKITGELERAGLWHRDGDAWVVHDFQDWNPPAADVLKKREEARERMRKAREAKAARSAPPQSAQHTTNADRTGPDCSQDVRANTPRTSREVPQPLAGSSHNPVPVPVPVPEISKADAADPRPPGGSNPHPPSAAAPAAAAQFAIAESVATGYRSGNLVPVAPEPKPQTPSRRDPPPAEVLALPIAERAQWLLENPHHRGGYYQPDKWPEVVAVAQALHSAAGLAPPRLGAYGRDAGVRSLVDAFAAGYPPNELLEVARRLPGGAWWQGRLDKGQTPGLSWLSLEVVRREASALPQAKPISDAVLRAAEFGRRKAKAVANG